jgi:Predicted ATPase (AAA+ superfamily)
MEELVDNSNSLIENTSMKYSRYLYNVINWNNRLIGIKGARGTGKTTLVLQRLKHLMNKKDKVLYVSLDDLYFTNNTLSETARTFYLQGGKILALDEVHKYANWSKEVKNLYDKYKDLQIIFTGSSILDITKQEADLSRRALIYELKGLSYREYIEMEHSLKLPVLTLDNLISAHDNIRTLFPKIFKPLAYFNEYLQKGYYPFYKEDEHSYHQRLRQLTRIVVEYDMAEIKGFDIRQAKKMLQLLYVIAQQVPFKPNLSSLADKTNIHRNSISNYLYFLEEARLISLLRSQSYSVATLQKPEKIFLDNTNLVYALSEQEANIGSVRETFFFNQVSTIKNIQYSERGDFLVNKNLIFEVGGKDKNVKQIEGLKNAYVVKDNIEYPVENSFPLWVFGFLY